MFFIGIILMKKCEPFYISSYNMKLVKKRQSLHWVVQSFKSVSAWGDTLLIIIIDTHTDA